MDAVNPENVAFGREIALAHDKRAINFPCRALCRLDIHLAQLRTRPRVYAGDAVIGTIYLLGIFTAVLVNITALTLLVLRIIPVPATARASGLLAVCLALFSLEHGVGLGKLYGLGLPLTALSLYVIWHDRTRFVDASFRTSEIVFLCTVFYGLVWRLSSPDIVEDNDRLTDFHLLANYLSGEGLPPLDYWLPHQRLNYYYTFQHYSAALLGRIFGLGPGLSFNMAAVDPRRAYAVVAWEFLTLVGVFACASGFSLSQPWP